MNFFIVILFLPVTVEDSGGNGDTDKGGEGDK